MSYHHDDTTEASHSPAALLPDGIGPMDGGSRQEGAWSIINDRLRGRWRYAVMLGLLAALVLAPLGYLSTHPQFESTGLIRVAPKLDHVLRETPETELMPLYSQYVQTQAQMIASQRVLQEALKNETMRTLPWAKDATAVDRMGGGLVVDAPRNSQMIIVTYAADNPAEAEIAVNAVLKAFSDQAGINGGSMVSSSLSTLQARKTTLNRELHDSRQAIQALPSVREFGSLDLAELLRAKVEQLTSLARELNAVRISLAITPSSAAEDETAATGTAPIEPLAAALTDAQMDSFDPQLAEYRRIRDAHRMTLEQVATQVGPSHRAYKRAEADLETATRILEEREGLVREQIAASGGALPDAGLQNGLLSESQLRAKEGILQTIHSDLSADVQQISADLARAQEHDLNQAQLHRELAEVEARITDLQIEAEGADRARVSVFQWGIRAPEPARDRRIPLAALGAFGGFAGSFGLFFLVGTLDRRAYHLQQLRENQGLRCLGVLPDLGSSAKDPDGSEMAAHCVHQIRNLIEAVRPASKSIVLAVSSPFQGDGKTSITLALGFSYAAAGHRTVVVDGDLVGRGLTRQLGLVGAQGLKEVLRDGHLNGEVVPLATTGAKSPLSALPVGVDSSVGSEGVRRRDVEALFDQLRERFDVIIVDTGPVLGSLECVPITSAADGVVLSVRRGRQRHRVQECVNYLHSVGARCFGVVLNCATRSDCNRYVSEASLHPTRTDLARSGSRAGSPSNALVSAVMGSASTRDKV